MLMGMNTRPDPRRRLFQFSLKSVFILILVVAAFFGGMAVKQRQMEVIMAEAERGGRSAVASGESLVRRAACGRPSPAERGGAREGRGGPAGTGTTVKATEEKAASGARAERGRGRAGPDHASRQTTAPMTSKTRSRERSPGGKNRDTLSDIATRADSKLMSSASMAGLTRSSEVTSRALLPASRRRGMLMGMAKPLAKLVKLLKPNRRWLTLDSVAALLANCTVLAIVTATSFVASCFGEEFSPFDGPKPIAIFLQSNPWAKVIGSDTPRVAVYEDGEIIYARKLNNRLDYFHLKLNEEAFAEVRKKLEPVLALKELKPAFDMVPRVTDQPRAMFYLRDGEREATTTVYGLLDSGTRQTPYTSLPDAPMPDVPPDELLTLHRWLCELDFADAEEWVPKYVEVLLWGYSYAPDPSINWPKQWPSLTSERVVRRGKLTSIFLDGSMLPKLRNFLASRSPKGAVELDGSKWAASYRYTFVGEPIWRHAFSEAAKKHRESREK